MTQHAVPLDHRQLYRLPWTLPDNAISWLEPTSACNLACDGCYRENVAQSHKSLDVVRAEIDTFRRLRNADGISIAGGDPLMHPQITEIVRIVAEAGLKPIINTNGERLTEPLLLELKAAGVYGFTFHIDSKQGRPHWKGKTEMDLNPLRLKYARMLAEVGGISCAFNATIYEDTFHEISGLTAWAAEHIDIVQVMVFILYRAAVPNLPFDWYVGGRKVDMQPLVYSEQHERKIDLKSTDVVAQLQNSFPDFMPCAYLNGTERPDSYKWLLSVRVGSPERIYGYVGAKYIEFAQTVHHLVKGRYLAYAEPSLTRRGRTMMLFSFIDKGFRRIAKRYFRDLLTRPWKIFTTLHMQSVMIIQPVDFLENGRQNMCDGCPDITVWNGELVWSCRMEELKQFGSWVHTVPKGYES